MTKQRFSHVVDALEQRAREQPQRVVYTYLRDGERLEQPITFGDLFAQASRLSGALSARTQVGDRVLILLPPSADFFAAFWACLHAGTIPCVAYPPGRVGRAELAPLVAMARDARATLVLTNTAIERAIAALPAPAPDAALPPLHAFEELLGRQVHAGRRRDTEIAYLQYTSGSTSAPKGVRVTQRGLAEHLEHLCERFAYTPSSIGVSWLPVHHSFGLVAGVLIPMYAGCSLVAMSPGHFLERPLRWLEAIHKYRGSHSGAPNFAYDLVSAQVAAGHAPKGLDLSCWRLAGVGGEAVQPGTLERFQGELAKVGMPVTALSPSYGLSEATLTVSTSPYQAPVVLTLDGEALQRGRLVPCAEQAPNARPMVSVGRLMSGFEVQFVDPLSETPCASDVIGEVWLRGAAVADGYWGRPEESGAVFQGQLRGGSAPYLRTGDLGFMHGGELFITGRCKELIIVRGLNFFPADIEATVRHAASALENAPVAAFPWLDESGDGLGVALELTDSDPKLIARIRARLATEHGVECSFLCVVAPNTLPRTGSGKLQRLLIARLAQAGELQDEGRERRVLTTADAAPTTWGLAALRHLLAEQEAPMDDSFGPETRLDTLALSSLRMVRLSAEIKLRYGRDVSLSLLLEPSAKVASVLAVSEHATAIEPSFDYQKDARLPADIADALARHTTRKPPRETARPCEILLTGATGYLGANILQELLRKPGGPRVHCLVRAATPEEAVARLRASVKNLSGEPLPTSDALQVWRGDVAEQGLGLAREDYEALSRSVDRVIHAAAHVNFVYPYSALRGANVLGTQEVLRFCTAGPAKDLHFLSTAGVLATGEVHGPARPEVEAIEPEARLLVGYEQSKWVADRVVGLAREAGQCAFIYRVGFVGGRADDGALLRSNEFFPSLLRGCVALGVYPALTSSFGFVPVDWVARAVVSQVHTGASAPASRGVDLHLVHLEAMGMEECFLRLREHGYPLAPLPFDAWKRRLFATPLAELRKNALFDYLSFLQPLNAGHLQLPPLAFSVSRSLWDAHPCPPAAHLLDACLARLQATGELPPPPR